MATNKMKLKHAYRAGGDDYVQEVYGVRIIKDDKSLYKQIKQNIAEHEEIMEELEKEDKKEDLEERMEYLETLDINQLRGLLKSSGLPHKTIMKFKKEEMIAELLK
jgi:DNA-binding transcriptional regulator GbsR (MarR family)